MRQKQGKAYRGNNSRAGNKRRRKAAAVAPPSFYEALELRQVLAAIFPTWVNGTFTLGDPVSATPYQPEDTFFLSSNPTALHTIYLDFDGHHSVNNAWNHDIVFPMYDRDGDNTTFNTAELIEIQKIFQNVAEDFLPFDVNVTTTDPGLAALTRSSPNDTTWGIRVVHTQATSGFGNGIGGVAFLDSFNDSNDNPCFAFNKGVNNGAMTISHEVGHTLGLRHDGIAGSGSAYHPGVGTGPTSWGPIMGAPFGKNLSQWSQGEYDNPTNTEDDLALITRAANGVSFRTDDVGDSTGTAAALSLTSPTTSFDWGIIGHPSDVDYYFVDAGAGKFNVNLSPFGENPNLDISATLFDADGNVVATSNPVDDVVASFSIPDIAKGRYYISVDGFGKTGVYTDYGSMGFYTIEAEIQEFTIDAVQIAESGTIEALREFWVTVPLGRDFENPVVVAGPATRRGGDPVTIRVRNVTSNSFQIALDEWDYLDGRHTGEQVSWLVMEAGFHRLEDGTMIQAGTRSVNHQWSSVVLPQFDVALPIVFSQVMTQNDPAALVTRLRSVTNSGFQVRLQTEQAGGRITDTETVGWIAITPGSGVSNRTNYEIFRTAVDVDHTDYSQVFVNDYASRPVFLASMQSFFGGDTASIRLKTIDAEQATFFVEEERSFDDEINHNREQVGYLAMEPGAFSFFPDSPVAARMMDSGSAGQELFTRVTTDPVLLEAAIKQIESWGEDSMPLGHDDNGGCCCGECVGRVAAAISTDGGLAAALLRGNSPTAPLKNPTGSISPATGAPAADLADLTVAGTELLSSRPVFTRWTSATIRSASNPETDILDPIAAELTAL